MCARSARKGHFKLASGHHGDLWFQLERLCLEPLVVRNLAAELAARLRADLSSKALLWCPWFHSNSVAILCTPSGSRTQDARACSRCSIGCRQRCKKRSEASASRSSTMSLRPDQVRGSFVDLQANRANVLVIGVLLALGDAVAPFASEHHTALELLERLPNNLWTPAECPLCIGGVALEIMGTS